MWYNSISKQEIDKGEVYEKQLEKNTYDMQRAH